MNQTELLNNLLSFRFAAIYDIFAQVCLHETIKKADKGEFNLEEIETILPEGKINFQTFLNQLNTMAPNAAVETKRNANRFLTRNLLKEGFRLTQSYCQENGRESEFTSESWYQFARIVVNCLSHSFTFSFRPYDLTKLPVSYNGVTIDSSNDGNELSMKLEVLLSLFDEIISFVKNKLT